MTDTREESSAGEVLFRSWAAKHMTWTDVGVWKNETSFRLVRKDSDEERGKRLCASGRIIQIAVRKLDDGSRTSEGLLMSDRDDLYSFAAVGSSGKLVEDSYARFCGVVAGRYEYANSAGGTGHAITVIGMFDLPENRMKKRGQAGVSRSANTASSEESTRAAL